ncbi:MAG: hypothetical protein J0L84_13940 [Verrucomicrobia bacterium]|nr:hypothetical protein [Verrucomicrobiota bacterium]
MVRIERNAIPTHQFFHVLGVFASAMGTRLSEDMEFQGEQVIEADHAAGDPVKRDHARGAIHAVEGFLVHDHEVESVPAVPLAELDESRLLRSRMNLTRQGRFKGQDIRRSDSEDWVAMRATRASRSCWRRFQHAGFQQGEAHTEATEGTEGRPLLWRDERCESLIRPART